MATAAHIPVNEYLSTSYEPDCDYVDGELQERNLGELSHALVQKALMLIFHANRRAWRLRPVQELRLQVSATSYRIPDVCLMRPFDPFEPVLSKPPFICIEVLSPEDRLQRTVSRVQDYRTMGVEHIWIIDPGTRECWTIDDRGGALPMLNEAFAIPGTSVRVAISDIFEEIDAGPAAL